jgi:hypothetical protein
MLFIYNSKYSIKIRLMFIKEGINRKTEHSERQNNQKRDNCRFDEKNLGEN